MTHNKKDFIIEVEAIVTDLVKDTVLAKQVNDAITAKLTSCYEENEPYANRKNTA